MKNWSFVLLCLFTLNFSYSQRIMNSSRSTIAYFEDGRFLNSSRATIGYLEDGRVMNRNRSTIKQY